jgi:hypothetical protein
MERRFAHIRQLVEHTSGYVHRLSCGQYLALFAKAHFCRPIDNEVNFFLFLIVPWDLAPLRLKRHIPHAEHLRLDRRSPAYEVLRPSPRRVVAPFYLTQISNNHDDISRFATESPITIPRKESEGKNREFWRVDFAWFCDLHYETTGEWRETQMSAVFF